MFSNFTERITMNQFQRKVLKEELWFKIKRFRPLDIITFIPEPTLFLGQNPNSNVLDVFIKRPLAKITFTFPTSFLFLLFTERALALIRYWLEIGRKYILHQRHSLLRLPTSKNEKLERRKREDFYWKVKVVSTLIVILWMGLQLNLFLRVS